jgi:hypothetical protein
VEKTEIHALVAHNVVPGEESVASKRKAGDYQQAAADRAPVLEGGGELESGRGKIKQGGDYS